MAGNPPSMHLVWQRNTSPRESVLLEMLLDIGANKRTLQCSVLLIDIDISVRSDQHRHCTQSAHNCNLFFDPLDLWKESPLSILRSIS